MHVRPGELSANLLPLTISERVAHARLAALRRADRWNGGKAYRGDRRGRYWTHGGWTNRRQVDRTLTKRLHLSVDTLANASGICCFDIDREEGQRTQGCANSTVHSKLPTSCRPKKARYCSKQIRPAGDITVSRCERPRLVESSDGRRGVTIAWQFHVGNPAPALNVARINLPISLPSPTI